MSRPRKPGPREPNGRVQRGDQKVRPTVEMQAKRKAIGMDVSLDHPLDVLYADGQLRRHYDEDSARAMERRDAGAAFARLAWQVWGQPFAGIDERSRRLVAPSLDGDDADTRRARQTDLRSPEERAEDVRAKCEAMMLAVDRNVLRGRVLRHVAIQCRTIEEWSPDRRMRKRLLRLLLDALDLLADQREMKRMEDAVRGGWGRRAAA